MKLLTAFVAFTALAALAVACQPPDCDRPDSGSCGNACCLMNFGINAEATELKDQLETLLLKGGPDGRYTLMATAEDPSKRGFFDLRGHGLNVSYIGQAWHTTKTHHYNDTIDMTIADGAVAKTSVLRAFSTSLIAGAYGDDGQNYKNLIQVVKALGINYIEYTLLGCPKP